MIGTSRRLWSARAEALAFVASLCGCAPAVDGPRDPPVPTAEMLVEEPPSAARSSSSSAPAPAVSAASGSKVDVAAYPWLGDPTCAAQTVTGPLSAQIAAPAGFERARVAEGSFGAWLRGLPMRPKGPVVD